MDNDCRGWLERNQGDRTLLGVCPMTEEIVRAAIREAASEEFVPMFIATPRQVDANRGYTGWSQTELVGFVESICEDVGYDGPYLLARDHGGPYQSTRDRDDESVDLDDAMRYAKELFSEDLNAGFDVLHVDATEDPRVDGPLALEEIARRTVELIAAIERERERGDHSEVYYEVGTEEIAGGMTDPADFAAFLDLLEEQLEAEVPGAFDRVIFAVGQVGTTMRIDMTNEFAPEKAAELVDIADERGLFVKTHFTDWLPTETLERFPELGIGAANVGPEFAAAIAEALADLERTERRLIDEAGEADRASEFMETFETAAVRDAPWKKYAPADLDADEREPYADQHRREIALCVGRYVLSNPEVAAARERLYENVEEFGSVDPDAVVTERVRETIDRYVRAFN